MGLATFRQGSSSSTGNSPIYTPKLLPVSNLLYGGNNNLTSIPVIRSGVTDKIFTSAVDDTQIQLNTFSALGVMSTVATITFTTYLASSHAMAVHLNSADTCLYVLLYASSNYQLIKVNDTTGVVTAIGSSFTPTTAANWPTGITGTGKGLLEVDSVSGHLKITCNGFTHLVNKTTGAIVSQNTVISLGSYLAKAVIYVTQDSSIGVSSALLNYGVASNRSVAGGTHSTYGQYPNKLLPLSYGGVPTLADSGIATETFMHLIDTDKVLLGQLFTSSGSAFVPPHILTRTEFDKYVKSVANFALGI